MLALYLKNIAQLLLNDLEKSQLVLREIGLKKTQIIIKGKPKMKINLKIQTKWYICYSVSFKNRTDKQVETFLDFHHNCIRQLKVSFKGVIKTTYRIRGVIII